MRALVEIIAKISSDDNGIANLIDLDEAFDDNDADRVKTYQAGRMILAASATDTQVAFGGVTSASLVIIIAHQAVLVKMNGSGNDGAELRPIPAVEGTSVLSSFQRYDRPAIMIWPGKVDSLHLSNPSDTDTAQVDVVLVGEAE